MKSRWTLIAIVVLAAIVVVAVGFSTVQSADRVRPTDLAQRGVHGLSGDDDDEGDDDGDGNTPGEGGALEVVVGYLSCSPYTEDVLYFDGTSGVGDIAMRPLGAPVPGCAEIATAASAAAAAQGCTVGPSGNLPFVCQGERDEVVNAIHAIAAAVTELY